ncbi:TetR/AcrR family transcriptional regulator [Blastococcus deserti]|uniref:Helix-turn-helix domain-containing protein n=1 Tax=Blastococcus deserti TaxID=2259033 RepID=A0ABW4XCT0_9ACTN
MLVPLADGGPGHPGASASCTRLFGVTLGGLREEAAAHGATASVVALANAAYDAQHPVAGDDDRLRTALDWAARDGTNPRRRRAVATFRAYPGTVSELNDRRARKKARTREQIRAVAHRLFDERGFDAVTIADVAREADVAVQTVFNHFATKEELFFDGRTPWVDGPADAVRSRDASVAPLTALRSSLVQFCGSLVGSLATPERQRYMATLHASDTLLARERELVFECERRLTTALVEAWTTAPGDHAPDAPADPRTAAPLIAATWLTAARVLIMQHRPLVAEGADAAHLSAAVEDMADCVFGQMEAALAVVAGRAGAAAPVGTGRPRPAACCPGPARRAG